MRESPRIRRLRSDLQALETLRKQSTIFDFSVPGPLHRGLPETYVVHFRGGGIWRPPNSEEVFIRQSHEVSIVLGAEYPRMMPEMSWRTPIFHPNVSGSGVICLGGYGTYWAPSLSLDELCHMLWDMVRYENFDIESPYNREAAHWAREQQHFSLPVDIRPLRDRTAGLAVDEPTERKPPVSAPRLDLGQPAGIVDAEIVEPDEPEILFID